jgi:phage/plasmid-like protein (TIGR03299 family)
MAHNLNINQMTGKASFFSVKEKAWHGLGQIVDQYPTSAEAIEAAQLNWEVARRPIFTPTFENGKTEAQPDTEIKTHFATVRTDTEQVLGIVGSRYEVVQNRTAFCFFDAIVGGDEGIMYETAGALGNGERIFITAKLPGYIKVDKSDLIEQYIFLTTTHDGSGSIQAAFTPVRIVCNNTLTAALRDCSNMVTIRHTASAPQQLAQAHRVMGISYQLAAQLEPIFQGMAKSYITDAETKRLISLAMAPSDVIFQAVRDKRTNVEFSKQYENIISDVYEYAQTAETQQMNSTRGTLFGAYNAITGYYQNVKDWKSADAKMGSLLDGTASERSRRAFDLCQNFTEYLS